MTGGPVMTDDALRVTFRPSTVCAQPSTSGQLALQPSTVDIWGWRLDGRLSDNELFHSWLDEHERQRASRFVRQRDRQRYLEAHGCVRAVLGRYLDCPPHVIQFRRTASEKPFVAAPVSSGSALHFSLTHSGDCMLVALSLERELGVDLEAVRPETDVMGLAERFYATDERQRLSSLAPQARRAMFFRHWVAKESMLKGIGMGIPALQDCEVLPASDRRRAIVSLRTKDRGMPQWEVEWLSCGVGWEAAVAARGSDWTVRCPADW